MNLIGLIAATDGELHEIVSCAWWHGEHNDERTEGLTTVELAQDEHAMLHAILWNLHPKIVWQLRGLRACSLCRSAVRAHIKECWKCRIMQNGYLQSVLESAGRRKARDSQS